MPQMEYCIDKDLMLIKELLCISQEQLAKALSIDTRTIQRWVNKEIGILNNNIEKVYTYAYKNNIRLNKIKEQLYQEEYTNATHKVLFHGAKNKILGDISLEFSKASNDFGNGFYCGETLEQSALFVSSYKTSSIYVMVLNCNNLKTMQFQVDQDWMLTIAYFRGNLKEYENSERLKNILSKLTDIDCIIAPIADNRMFQIIDSFIQGEITDEQCKHCLAATNLGYQYVFKTQKALDQCSFLEHCYLCLDEKESYLSKRSDDAKFSEDKIRIARRQYRGKGHYIDEIL